MVYYGKKRGRLIESEEHTMGRKKREIAKTCLCYFLVCLISFLCIADMPSYKAKASEAIKSVHTSFYEKENIAISIKNEMLYFTKLPDRNSFSKIKVSLYSEGGKKSNEKTLSGSMPYCYNLSGVQNGTYYLQLYYMTKQDDQGRTYYLSYWYQKSGIVLVKDSSGWSILNATPYEKNKEIFSIRSNSGEVLDYFLQPDYMVDSENSQIVSTAKSITKGITNDYDKVVAVHDWVAKNICYDYDGLYGRTDEVEYIASDVLKSKKSVCQGFADLSAALLRAVNIPTRVVDGYALGIGSTSEWTDDIFDNETINHAWNEAYVDGRWIIFDATWDSGNAYENGSYKFSDSEVSYQYFDPTIEVFSSTHYIVDEEGTEFLNQLSDNDLDENISLYEGSKKKIFNEVPDDIAVKWEIANEEVVDITKDGNLKGMVPGSSEVKLIFSKGNCMKTINLKVNVVEQGSSLETIKAPTPTPKEDKDDTEEIACTNAPVDSKQEELDIEDLLEQISPNMTRVDLYCGGNMYVSKQLLYYVPDEISGQFKVRYKIENPQIATINSSGWISAKKQGKTNLIITYQQDGYESKDKVSISVKNANVSISCATKTIKKGKSLSLQSKSQGIKGTVKWKSSNTKVATVSKTGKVKGKKKGTAKITATIGKVKGCVQLKVK